MSREFSRAEVAKHNTADDCYIIINGNVYDVSKFAGLHPGGEQILLELGGTDCTEDFFGLHRIEVLDKFGPRLQVGHIPGTTVSHMSNSFSEISHVPFAESSFWRGFESPYYSESHKILRIGMRKFIAECVLEEAEAGEMRGTAPSKELLMKIGEQGIFAALLGPGKHLHLVNRAEWMPHPDEFDYFHENIIHEEFVRMMCPGFEDGISSGVSISVPILLEYGNEQMKALCPKLLRGEARSCLAITEPYAGSDVANVRTRAEKSPCGTFYIVNGVKKWITNGTDAEYFITLVRTGGKGAGGLSMLLIPRTEGVETKGIKTSYSSSAGTSYITFTNVKVPVENLINKEGNGFKVTMGNFNHERFVICVGMIGKCRVIIEECFKWANQRKVFNKGLIQQAVIQEKLAKIVARTESCYSWLENVTHQMNCMTYEEQNKKLGGVIALLKYEAAQLCNVVADEAVQIFGGRGVTSSGMGKKVERFQRTFKMPAVYGGSSEIMASLGIRQAMKNYPSEAKL